MTTSYFELTLNNRFCHWKKKKFFFARKNSFLIQFSRKQVIKCLFSRNNLNALLRFRMELLSPLFLMDWNIFIDISPSFPIRCVAIVICLSHLFMFFFPVFFSLINLPSFWSVKSLFFFFEALLYHHLSFELCSMNFNFKFSIFYSWISL